MKSTHKLWGLGMLLTLLLVASTTALAQRPRNINEQATPAAPAKPAPIAPAPPQGVKVKYEGGVFGYNKKVRGTLSLDDLNRRVLFRDKDQRELFSIPYDAVAAAFADTRSLRPTAATVIGSIPAPFGANIPAWFIRKKYRYLTVQYNDPDTNASGITSFKMENKQVLESVLNSLANKAGLTPRGEIFVRRKDSVTKSQQSSPE
jgi:hypothetical protein